MSNSAKASRATRLRRIPVRITHHSQNDVAPDWPAIEAAIGVTLYAQQRDSLATTLVRYRRDAPAARTAAPVKEVADRLAAIEEAALAFRNAILKAAPSGMAEAYARSVLEEFMRSTGRRDVDLDALWRITGDTAWAARAGRMTSGMPSSRRPTRSTHGARWCATSTPWRARSASRP